MDDKTYLPVLFYMFRSIRWSMPIQNSLRLFQEAGHDVHIYWLDDEYYPFEELDIAVYSSTRICVPLLPLRDRTWSSDKLSVLTKLVRSKRPSKSVEKRSEKLFQQLRACYIGLFVKTETIYRIIGKIKRILNDKIYLIKSLYFCAVCFFKTNKKKKYILIAYDPPSLFVANLIAKFKNSILVYWSSELIIYKDLEHVGEKLFKYIEKKCNRNALCTVEFGEDRCELLRTENGLQKESMISIPNSSLGHAKIERNYYFNKKFGISLDKKIILHAGSTAYWTGLEEVLSYVDTWPLDCVLVIHSKSHTVPPDRWKEMLYKNQGKVFLSSDPVPFSQLSEIYSSADIGLQVWKPTITNMRVPGLSSSKVFHYLQFGVPVIVRNLQGYTKFVEQNGIGLCISHASQIGSKIEQIFVNEAFYKNNCLRIFNEFKFEYYHKELVHRVDGANWVRH